MRSAETRDRRIASYDRQTEWVQRILLHLLHQIYVHYTHCRGIHVYVEIYNLSVAFLEESTRAITDFQPRYLPLCFFLSFFQTPDIDSQFFMEYAPFLTKPARSLKK